MARKTCGFGCSGARFATHQCIEFEREKAFRVFRIFAEQHFGDDKPEHPVAEKFQPLVGQPRTRACVSQRACKEPLVPKNVAEPVFDLGEIRPVSQ